MIRLLAMAWVVLLGCQTVVAQDGAANSKTIILVIPTAIDHAWNTHMYDHECKFLVKCLNRNPGVKAVLSPDLDWPKDPKVLQGVKSIVFYSRPAGDIIFAPERRAQTKELFDSGEFGSYKEQQISDYGRLKTTSKSFRRYGSRGYIENPDFRASYIDNSNTECWRRFIMIGNEIEDFLHINNTNPDFIMPVLKNILGLL